MAKSHSPRKGSLQFWPRKRAKKPKARIRNWLELDGTKLMAFLGYKVGMCTAVLRDNAQFSLTKGKIIPVPVTIVECPPLKPLSIKFYKKTDKGLNIISEILAPKLDKKILKELPKKKKAEPKSFDDVRLVVYTQPNLTTIGAKTSQVFEITISGKDPNEKLFYAKNLLEKQITINDVFKEGQYLDAHSITKGKGFQGTVKRFGVKIRQHKSEKTKRGVGTLGAWTPKRVLFSVPQPGKLGYHQRTEYNKLNLKIGNNPKEINPKSGFLKYGLVKNDFMLIKGSIPGAVKRTIILTEPLRAQKLKTAPIEITSINVRSKS